MGTHSASPPSLRIRLLGPAEITANARILSDRDWSGRRARALLLLLAGSPGHRLHREQIIDLLWPDADLDAGANALYKALHALRRSLEPNLRTGRDSRFITVSGTVIGIDEWVACWIDVEQFSALLARAGTLPPAEQRTVLRTALDLYRGEYLADERYAEWPVPRREALRADYERAVLELATLDLDAAEPLASIPWLEALLGQDPTSESVHRALMRAYHAAGQRSLALRQYERCRDQLRREFDDEPEAETTRLAESIRQAPSPLDTVTTSQVASARYRSLPAMPNRTVGRGADIASVASLVRDPAVRLVTIVGTGGIGKTRLATEVATSLKAEFPDGAGFVPLAAVRNPDLIHASIATTLQIAENPRQSTEEVVTGYFEARTYLLVLDNLEQIAGCGALVARLLEACPSLTILATSREPLRIRAEQLYRLDVLAVPTGNVVTTENLEAVEATALFLQHLRSQRFGYTASPQEATAIADLCVRLDGLPLAIELAAARCYDLSPIEVLAQINQRTRIHVLHDGPHDLPARHQTLQDLVLWSYDLLTESEQRLFRRLAVFAGGAELDALEAIGGENAIALANALETKSLIQWTHVDGVRRLVILETIREVAAMLLDSVGEQQAAWSTTTSFYAALSKRAYVELRGAQQLPWYDRLARDMNIIRAVLEWSVTNEPDEALTIAGHLQMFWFYRHSTQEGQSWIERTLAATPDRLSYNRMIASISASQNLDRIGDYDRGQALARQAANDATALQDLQSYASALRQWASSAFRSEDVDGAMRLLAESIEISRAHNDPHGIGHCLVGQALYQRAHGDFAGATRSLEQALETARLAEHHMLQPYILMHLANIVYQSDDLAMAAEVAKECERTSRIADSRLSLPWALVLQALIAFSEARYSEGLVLAQEASALFTEFGDRRGASATLVLCGMLETCLGNTTHAAQRFLSAIPDVRRVGFESDKYDFLMETALLAHATGQKHEALTLLTTYNACRLATGVPRSPGAESRFEESLDAVRSSLDLQDADRAWARGEAMSLEEGLDLVQEVCERVLAPANQARIAS